MRYMMMIKSDAATEAGAIPEPDMLAAMGKYNQALIDAGALLGAEGLHASAQGCRVRWTEGKIEVFDGPFAEAKELIAGFWLIRADDKQAAVAWAKRVPITAGEVEVRRVYDPEDFPVDDSEKPEGWRDQEVRMRAQTQRTPSKLPRFIVMLKSHQATESGVLPGPEVLERMGALLIGLASKNALFSGDGLAPTRQGARVFFAGNDRRVVDGPFSETKELIAGYTILRAANLAEAIEFAKSWIEIHASAAKASECEMEIRRVFESDEVPVDPSETRDGWREQERSFRERTGTSA